MKLVRVCLQKLIGRLKIAGFRICAARAGSNATCGGKSFDDGSLGELTLGWFHDGFLAFLHVYCRVGLELEDQVASVDEKQDNSSRARYGGCTVGFLVSGIGGVIGDGELIESGGNDDGCDGEGQKGSSGRSDGDVEELLFTAETTKEETHSHHKK